MHNKTFVFSCPPEAAWKENGAEQLTSNILVETVLLVKNEKAYADIWAANALTSINTNIQILFKFWK